MKGNTERHRKRTYALPAETLDAFEDAVAPGGRSAVVAKILHEWVEERHREKLRQEIIEGCREMADEYIRIEREFHPLEEEVQRRENAGRHKTRRRPRRSA
jgi:hypothetical protein